MLLKEKLFEDLKTAMKASQQSRVDLLRLIINAVKNKEIEKKKELSDEDVTQVIISEAKKRTDAIDLFIKGGRKDLAEKEKKESEIIGAYLPKMMSAEEAEKIIEKILHKNDGAEFGVVMKEVMAKLKGKADSKLISEIVKDKLSK